MKKLTAILLVLSLAVSSFAFSAFAGGYGDASASVEDTIADDAQPQYDEAYTAAFNDCESISTADLGSGFTVENTGDGNYGKAIAVPNSSWAVANGNATYTYAGKTISLFNEPLTKDKNYILQYDYKSELGCAYKYAFTFCPKYTQFWRTVSGDHRDYPPYFDDEKWHRYAVGFTAEDTSAKLKLNTAATYTKSYVDNIMLVEAATVTVNGDTYYNAVNVKSGLITTNTKNGLILSPKGNRLTFTLNVANGFSATVKAGETIYTPDEKGIYTIPKLTNDLSIDIKFDVNSFKRVFFCDSEDNVYFPYGYTINDIFRRCGTTTNNLIKVTSNGKALNNDEIISVGDKVSFSESNDNVFTVKLLGDTNNDGVLTVTDITYITDCIINSSDLENRAYDVNMDGRVSVADITEMRYMILEAENIQTADSTKVAALEADINNIISKSGVEVTADDLANSVYNLGNRSRVANAIRKAMRGEDISIVTFGGSITNGAGAVNPADKIPNSFSDTDCYAVQIYKWFKNNFESYGGNVNFFNAGIGATDTPYGIHRMGEDVLAHNPDLVIIEWDMNDNTAAYKQATYENMIRKLLDAKTAVVMLSMAGTASLGTQNMHEPLADFYDIPYISYRDAFSGKSYFANLTNDRVHPNIVGHHLTAMLLENFFTDVYKSIDKISNKEYAKPETTYTKEGALYGNTYIATLADIADGKVKGVKMISTGSFTRDTSPKSFAFRKYYGYTASYSENYQPMVLKVDSCHTLFMLMMRSYGMGDGKFELEINGERIVNPTFTCSATGAKDNNQIENQYHWASERACYFKDGKDITLKIYPTNKERNEYVRLFALLLS